MLQASSDVLLKRVEDTLQFLVWFLGIPVALGALALAGFAVEWAVAHIKGAVTHCQNRLDDCHKRAAEDSLRWEDHRAFLEWLAMKTGSETTGAIDERLVEAQQQAEMIRILLEEVPQGRSAVRRDPLAPQAIHPSERT